MTHAISRFAVLRVLIFVVLMVCSWAIWLCAVPEHTESDCRLVAVFLNRALVCLGVCLVSERATVGVALLVERAGDDFTRTLVAEQMSMTIHTPNPY